MKKVKFDVKGMTCAACSSHVDKATKSVDGVLNVNVNLLSNSMEVTYDEQVCSVDTICAAVLKAGYEAFLQDDIKVKKQKDNKLLELIISFTFLLLLMYVSMGHMINLPLPSFLNGINNAVSFAFTQFILVLPILYIYRRYFISGYKKLFKRKPNMDSLIAIGATSSLVYGIVAIYMLSYGITNNDYSILQTYYHNLYFESAGMILTLVSLGKYLESLSKKKTTNAISKLINLSPKMATVIRDNKEVIIQADDVKVGEIVVCKKGDIIPVDGVIVDGNGSLEEANITGEAIPKFKKKNDDVYSSTTLTAGYLKVKALKVKDDTSIATIIRLVEEASNSKAPISKLVDKVAGIFVPIIMSIAMITLIVNLLLNRSFELSFNFAISVLVIACPCALGLATPVAIMVGTGKGAETGLIIKNAEILEKAHLIKTIVFDKTGTITIGKPEVIQFESYSDIALNITYSIESLSEHPLASAMVQYSKNHKASLLKVDNYETLDGLGVKGVINNQDYFVGNERLLFYLEINDKQIQEKLNSMSQTGHTCLVVCNSSQVLGFVAIKDKVKESSAKTIEVLRSMGIKTIMLTGDNYQTAIVVAKEVGIDEVLAEVLPLEKDEMIKRLKKDSHHLVAMVGDGVNDSIALTNADLGIAIGGGSDVAMETSDIVLLKADLFDIVNVIRLSKRVLNTIKGNLFWAFFYNCIGVILATGILYPTIKLNPMIGSLAMSFSSVFVVLNALTINLFKKETFSKEEISMDAKTIVIGVNGMMCKHCKAHVENACLEIDNVSSAIASLEEKNVTVTYFGVVKEEAIKNAIIDAGYDIY